MENLRLLLIAALTLTTFLLWDAWHKDYGAITAAPPLLTSPAPLPDAVADHIAAAKAVPDSAPASDQPVAAITGSHVSVTSDLLTLKISTVGGTIEAAALNAYPTSTLAGAPAVELLATTPERVFIEESGLTGSPDLPTHHAAFTADKPRYDLAPGTDEITVPLHWVSPNGIAIEKRITLKRGSYVISTEYTVANTAASPLHARLYDQLKRNNESSRHGMVYTFTGPALSTPDKRFEKFKFDAIRDKPIDITADKAWIGIIQHYFVAALIPTPGTASQFYSKVLDDTHYLVGFLGAAIDIAPAATQVFTTTTYIGPKRHDIISNIAPGLELSVDFGVLWFIAKPLFIALHTLHDVTGNWGWAIILVTLCLKLMFYPLSAAGYRSMAKMRKVQPRMLALRERFGDDRTGLNQAMMKLYKDEKINPLGGCLPIVIQIPVFIALYWVLLESVEMRQAPFILWVQDLSERDPVFVLPLLMGISMWWQQKLNPAPLDPTQAKVMQIMPIMFTGFFAFFPSGLVLYWFVNNMLSIAQQWRITRAIEAAPA